MESTGEHPPHLIHLGSYSPFWYVPTLLSVPELGRQPQHVWEPACSYAVPEWRTHGRPSDSSLDSPSFGTKVAERLEQKDSFLSKNLFKQARYRVRAGGLGLGAPVVLSRGCGMLWSPASRSPVRPQGQAEP